MSGSEEPRERIPRRDGLAAFLLDTIIWTVTGAVSMAIMFGLWMGFLVTVYEPANSVLGPFGMLVLISTVGIILWIFGVLLWKTHEPIRDEVFSRVR